jgi:hypothetical protein
MNRKTVLSDTELDNSLKVRPIWEGVDRSVIDYIKEESEIFWCNIKADHLSAGSAKLLIVIGHTSKEVAVLISLIRDCRETSAPMSFEQVRRDSELHSSLDFQHHIGSRIIVSLVVLGLGWSGGRHREI